MKYFCQLLISILLITVAACGPSTPVPASDLENLATPEQSEEGLRVAPVSEDEAIEESELPPTPTTPAEEAYPAFEPPPTIDDMDESYPPPPSPLPSSGSEAYPAAENAIWVLFPVGEQCSDASRYEDLVTAVADLTAAGIIIYDSEVIELIVCSACGCPTSAHYRVSIDAAQLEIAESLEWTLEE